MNMKHAWPAAPGGVIVPVRGMVWLPPCPAPCRCCLQRLSHNGASHRKPLSLAASIIPFLAPEPGSPTQTGKGLTPHLCLSHR